MRSQWIFFGLTVAAVFVLRRKRPELPRPIKAPGYPVTPALFILATFLISLNSLIHRFTDTLAGLGIILLGLPAYAYWRRTSNGRPKSGNAPKIKNFS